jgi:hypothetical protein
MLKDSVFTSHVSANDGGYNIKGGNYRDNKRAFAWKGGETR